MSPGYILFADLFCTAASDNHNYFSIRFKFSGINFNYGRTRNYLNRHYLILMRTNLVAALNWEMIRTICPLLAIGPHAGIELLEVENAFEDLIARSKAH